jgi:RNA polymerase sigma factor (sigma-70 family)
LHEARGPTVPFDAVYEAELVAVVRLAALLVRSHAVAEELAQEAFVRLYQHFDEVENPAAFVRTAVARLCFTWLKRHGTEHRLLSRVGVEAPTSIPEIDETWEALGRLTPNHRAVLVLRYYEQLSHHEIADVLGCRPATIRSRARRALQDLRKELDRCARSRTP